MKNPTAFFRIIAKVGAAVKTVLTTDKNRMDTDKAGTIK